ncbi:TonB-dependent receptor plug domain-containing protein [Aureispira sp. CCB-E]|uniref:TonB-dependent receptor n=1 Tax=Aureispira sp. CCB-E TaxID=3051121 RepID=UPI0028687A00|nr:TonB-dependent receptor plug domain-containing protein [Aureispira sp. CCB-E]WMX12775.1 TonB-dependent receptor plug domain-containing protein [Aureispira sp. CCB-E]
MRCIFLLAFVTTLLYTNFSFAQDEQLMGTIIGTVLLDDGTPGTGVLILVEGTDINTVTSVNGEYKLLVPANKRINISYSYLAYKTYKELGVKVAPKKPIRLDVTLLSDAVSGPEAIVESFEKREIDALHVEKADIERIPTTDGNLTSLIKYLAPGVTAGTGGELTSQYSVRGGNYDENLVYVNDFEIYRPLLVRSGQQEGLIFPNGDMLDYLSFSSGGFKAQYGDKMASVLDVHYRRPYEFEASVGGSLLGGSVYVGGAVYKDSISKQRKVPNRFTYTLGARYKTTSYLLSSLDVKGEYVPQFVDIQGDFIYDINEKWQVEAIGHYSNSIYSLIPRESSTTTGLFNQALRLTTLFEGQEISNFENFTAGTAITFLPWGGGRDKEIDTTATVATNLKLKLLASHYQSNENERIDIINFYKLDEIETGLGEDNFGEVIGTLAYGETHHFARNFLQANVTNVQLKGTWLYDRYERTGIENHHWLKWGIGYKNEIINDKLKEWRRLDSLGYTLPVDTNQVYIPNYIRTTVNLNSHRLNAYVQNTWEHKSMKHLFRMTAGVRASYWTLNKELIVSPRLQMYYTPRRYQNSIADTTKKTKDLTFKLATGLYYQSPFYRELRDLRGEVNTGVRAQKSVHVLGGIVWDFIMFKRRFKFITEAYYKHQWDLIPYDIENVRIRYYGDNLATGYVAGLDLRLNGELVDGLESWINLSFLRARESFNGVNHGVRTLNGTTIDTTYLSDAPKATDQLVIFSMYFQDDFPKAPWARLNFAFTVGTGLPFGIPENNVQFRNSYRFAAYHRIDIGASFGLWDRKIHIDKKYDGNKALFKKTSKHALRGIRGIWVSFEVFNLMDVKNVASNTWIKDFSNRSYAIPNVLTSRRFNVRFKIDF